VVNEAGEILARTASLGAAWHSCRAVGMRDGVIMFAEYPPNAKADRKYPSRVFRSRDGGHTWTVAFQRSPDDIRHFHFLQPRPGAAGEWWLTSGDAPHESRIWVTRDDGGTWTDISGATERTAIGTARFGHDLYRLTDLAWLGDEVIWGTDDVLFGVKGAEPGARLFRSPIGAPLAPTIAGHARWHIRSLVDVGDHYVVISQGCPEPRAVARAEAAPGVYLMPKSAAADAPAMLHLFDIDTYSRRRTGFTYARASRAAKDGVFFTFRARTDVFPSGPQILKWEIAFA
jgi:hypothetical protein